MGVKSIDPAKYANRNDERRSIKWNIIHKSLYQSVKNGSIYHAMKIKRAIMRFQ